MSVELRKRIFDELDALVLIDPHTHINPLSPASQTLADILGYHYYTELAHSAGMPRELIEEPGLEPREKCRRLFANLGPLENTAQYSWFIELARELFGFWDERVTVDNWEPLYDAAAERMGRADWAQQVLDQSRLKAVFLTNEFDDPLEGFDTEVYIPCLRTDDLVFRLAQPEVRERLDRASGLAVGDVRSLRAALGRLFDHFLSRGARACAISLPPDFTPARVTAGRAQTAVAEVWRRGPDAHPSHRQALSHFVFWTLAELCDDYRLPFDLMIGVLRGVYQAGVYQGRDLYDSRVSLIQYGELFNAFPRVTFPVSVLASVMNQELVSYAWIFPNVVTSGHWWYSNTSAYIEHDLASRLEAVPATKQIGYYSDMYKLEFGLPKFRMYKRMLAKVLAERFVIDRGWTEERAVALGKQVLRENVDRIFPRPDPAARPPKPQADVDEAGGVAPAAAAVMAAGAMALPAVAAALGEPAPDRLSIAEPQDEHLADLGLADALSPAAAPVLPEMPPAEHDDPLHFLAPKFAVDDAEPQDEHLADLGPADALSSAAAPVLPEMPPEHDDPLHFLAPKFAVDDAEPLDEHLADLGPADALSSAAAAVLPEMPPAEHDDPLHFLAPKFAVDDAEPLDEIDDLEFTDEDEPRRDGPHGAQT